MSAPTKKSNTTSDELYEYTAYHVTWCTNRDEEFTSHTDDEPYCSHQVTGIRIEPSEGMRKTTCWVSSTQAFTNGKFTPADYADRENHYGGVEIAIDHWAGPGIQADEQKFRMNSGAARSLAAALLRAADIEQGLTR